MDCGPKAGTFGYLELALKGSADEFLDHGAAKLGELFVATGVEVGELIIVEAEEGAETAVKVSGYHNKLNILGLFLFYVHRLSSY